MTRPSSPPTAPPVAPASRRQAYDAAEAVYRQGDGGDALTVVGAGTLAWGESRVQESYLTMYEATGEQVYLDKLVAAGEAVLTVRDDRSGRVDDQGRCLPAWGAAEPYTVSCADLDGVDGRPALRVASTAAGVGARVAVRPRSPDLFDLLVTDPAGRSETVTGLSLDRRHPRYVVPTLDRRYPGTAGLTARDLRAEPRRPDVLAASVGAALLAQRYVFAVHTGMICAPFARLAVLLTREPALRRRYAAPAAALLGAAEEAVHVHDAEWRQLSAKAGLYAFGVGAPVWSDGNELPHNQYLAMARCQARLFQATGDPPYAHRARLMLDLFRSDLGTQAAPTWTYYRTGSRVYRGYEVGETASIHSPRMAPYRAAEDPSHGALDVDALVAGHDAGLGVPRSVLMRLVSTFLTLVLRRSTDGVWTSPARFGSSDDLPPDDLAAAQWVTLARWDPRVARRVALLLDQVRPAGAGAARLPVLAQLVRFA